MKPRHLARQSALQVLVSLLVSQDDDPKKVLSFVCREFSPQLKDIGFLESLVFGVLMHRCDIDAKIQKFAPEWPIGKLNSVERSLLEMGTFEICYTDTPVPVVINEMVELAKEFGDDTAGKFVNGVLSSIEQDEKKSCHKK
jgi:N utilization substance protein B